MESRSSDSLCVLDGLIRGLSICNWSWLRVFNGAFLGFLFGLRSCDLLSPSPSLFDCGYYCNCNLGACAETVEFRRQC